MRRTGDAIVFLFAALVLALPLRGAASGSGEGGKAAAAGVESPAGGGASGAAERGGPGKARPATVGGLESKAGAIPPGMPVYRPPLRGTPGGRVGGGTRGAGDNACSLCVLAPDHTGLTIREQPVLYWHLSGQGNPPVELTISEDNAVSPLLETAVKAPVVPGVNRVALADYGIRLAPDATYKWFVSIVADPARRSRDVVAGGMIRRVRPPESLAAGPADQASGAAVARYAEAGLWYDAVQAISDLIDASPGDALLRRQRASLMEQAGLPEVAEYDLERAR